MRKRTERKPRKLRGNTAGRAESPRQVYLLASIRKRHKVPMQKVRKALRYVETELGKARPLIEQDFLNDGVSLFVDHYARLVNVSSAGQTALRAGDNLRHLAQNYRLSDEQVETALRWESLHFAEAA